VQLGRWRFAAIRRHVLAAMQQPPQIFPDPIFRSDPKLAAPPSDFLFVFVATRHLCVRRITAELCTSSLPQT
jgi:hypothetical protein